MLEKYLRDKFSRNWAGMCLSRLEQMVTHHEDGSIVVCVFVFPPASPELTVTTAVIKRETKAESFYDDN